MMCLIERAYLYPKRVDFRKPIDRLTTLVELDIKVGGHATLYSSAFSTDAQPREDSLLGEKRLLTVDQAPGLGTFQNIT